MVDKVPGDITAGTASDDSKVHATQADNSLSRAHTERGISRLQGTAPDYSASKTYAINDLTTQDDVVFRCITAIITPEAFDDSKWQSISSTTHESQWKEPVILASTVDIDLSTGGAISVDGVSTSVEDRILVKDQTLPEENGIYIVNLSSWTRAEDMNAVGEFENAVLTAEQGATNASKMWIQTEIVTTINTDDVEFSIISFSGKLSDLVIDGTEKDWQTTRITNLGDPTGAQDAATKSYVDAQEESATNWKEPVLRATTSTDGNILLSGVQSVDGDNTSDGQRILVKNQSAPAENGIYIADSSTWSRALDMDEIAQFESAAVWVTVGNLQADTAWVQTLTVTTIGSSVVSFSKFASATGLSANVFSFSALDDYTTGNLVIHDNVLLRALENISAAAFDGDQWEQVINAPPFQVQNAYKNRDLVRHLDRIYECYNDVAAGNSFSLDNFRIINSPSVFSTRTFNQTTSDNVRIVGTPQNLDVVNSHNYDSRDISRLQSATQDYSGLISYNEGDFVLEDGIVYRAIADISAGELSDVTIDDAGFGYSPTGIAVTLTGFKSLEDGAVATADSFGSSITGFDITNGSTGYIQGESIQLEAIVGSGFEGTAVIVVNEFNIDEWFPISGVSVKNVVQVYSESDFPDVIDIDGIDMHPLENSVEYIMSAPVTLNNPIILEAGNEAEITAFTPFVNILTYSFEGALFRNRTGSSTYNSVENDSGDVKFITDDTDGIVVGIPINITSVSGEYTETNATVLAIDTNNSFTIAGTFGSVDTGSWDLFPKSLELHHIHVQGNDQAQTFDLEFTRATTLSFCEIHNCILSGFEKDGVIREPLDFRLEDNEFIDKQGELILENCETMRILNNIWKNVVAGSGNTHLDILGEILHGVIRDNSFETPDVNDRAIEIDNSISDDSRILIEGNVDRNDSKDTLFLSPGLDAIDPKLTVKNNVRQINSKVFAQIKSSGHTTNITNNSYTATTTNTWGLSIGEDRFENTDGSLEYVGLESALVTITYTILFHSSGGNDEDLGAAIFLDTGSGFLPITSSEYQIHQVKDTSPGTLTVTFTHTLHPGHIILLYVRNFDSTDNIVITNANVVVTE
jgi:hypothetical protein